MTLARWITAATAAVAATHAVAACGVNLNRNHTGPDERSGGSDAHGRTELHPSRQRRWRSGNITASAGACICYTSRFRWQRHCYAHGAGAQRRQLRSHRDRLSKDDVRRILGAPASKIAFDNLRGKSGNGASKAYRPRKKPNAHGAFRHRSRCSPDLDAWR